MKRLLLVLGALSLAVMLLPTPTPAPAQDDWDIQFRAKRRAAPPAATLPPVYAVPAAPQPALIYAGTGCRGQYQAGGCQSRMAAPPVTMYAAPAPVGGCAGKMAGGYGYAAGCQGGQARGYGFAAPGYGAPVVYAGPRPFAYGVDGVPLRRGDPRGDGRYATESGKPLPPGVIPWNGPIVGTLRDAAGYNRRR